METDRKFLERMERMGLEEHEDWLRLFTMARKGQAAEGLVEALRQGDWTDTDDKLISQALAAYQETIKE